MSMKIIDQTGIHAQVVTVFSSPDNQNNSHFTYSHESYQLPNNYVKMHGCTQHGQLEI